MKWIATAEAPAAIGPYSQAVVSEGLLFTSGQIALLPNGELLEGGIQAQTRQVFLNLAAVLKAAGCEKTDVLKCTVFLTNLQDFQTVNELYAEWFGTHRPARSCVEVSALPKGVDVEIELFARVPSAQADKSIS